MLTVHYRRWSPPKSPVRVEFPAEVLHEIRAETCQDHDRGFLYGLRQHQNEVRVLAARRTPHADDPGLTGLVPVGIYISRVRGEVFLTDADLEHMEKHATALALVVAGSRAGFFAREPDGSLQAVRSYEEFSVIDAAHRSEPSRSGAAETERAVRHPALPPRSPGRWAATMMGLLVVPVAALAYLHPLLPQPPIELSLHEVSGQLVIAWNPRAVQRGGRLEIVDQGKRTVLPVSRGSSSATYAMAGGDVEVRLATDRNEGAARWSRARFVRPTAPVPSQTAAGDVAEEVAALEREARRLRESIAGRAARVEELTRQAGEILKR